MRTTIKSQFSPEQRATCHPKTIARNTFTYTRDGETVIRLHATDIVRKLPDGSVILNSGGWRTVTTKDRMNAALPSGYALTQARGEWSINGVPYFDGMNVPRDILKPKAKGEKALARELRERAMVRHGPRASVKRALKRYLYRKLGLVS